MTTIQMACRGINGGGSRCRNMVPGIGVCHVNHGGKVVGLPGGLLLKMKINEKWLDRVKALGVREGAQRNESAIDQAHADQAEALRRDPQAIRLKPDSGAPVFGKDGLRNSTTVGLLQALNVAGYVIKDVHWFRRIGDRLITLVIVYEMLSKTPMKVSPELAALINELLASAWDFGYVWANPPKDGVITDTVNLSGRQPGNLPRYRLDFDGGAWNALPG